jgi:hypothetical protein
MLKYLCMVLLRNNDMPVVGKLTKMRECGVQCGASNFHGLWLA